MNPADVHQSPLRTLSNIPLQVAGLKSKLAEAEKNASGEHQGNIFECSAELAENKLAAQKMDEAVRELAEKQEYIDKLIAEGKETQAEMLQIELNKLKEHISGLPTGVGQVALKHVWANNKSSRALKVLGKTLVRMLGGSITFVLRLWHRHAEEAVMLAKLEQFEANVDDQYDKDSTPGVHATGCRLLHQILRRMQGKD